MKISSIFFSFAIAHIASQQCAFARIATEKHRRDLNPAEGNNNNNRDVCVIGAGAAGVSAAYYLEGRGYSVSVFEKLDRVGGKCFSPVIGPNGENLELGAALLTADYSLTRGFIDQVGLGLKPPNNGTLTFYPSGTVIPRQVDPAIQDAVGAYIATITDRYSELLSPGFDTAGLEDAGRLQELTIPFYSWLVLYLPEYVEALVPFFTVGLPYYGYGLLTQIPAIYAIKFLNPLNTQSLLILGGLGDRAPLDFIAKIDGGFGELITRIADSLEEDVHLNADVTINRHEEDGDEPPLLRYRNKDGKQLTFRCDKIIIAHPQKASLMGYMGLDDHEKEIFEKPFTQSFFTSMAPIAGPLENGVYYNVQMATAQNWYGSTILFVKPYDDIDYVTLFQYETPGDISLTDQEICALAEEDLAHYSLNKDDIENFNRWAYFPAVSSDDVKNGFYEDLEALQGYRNTFYTGGLLNFELVENAMVYSKHLVETYFPDKNEE